MKPKNFLSRALTALVLLLAAVPAFAQFRVIGYLPSWTGDVNAVQYDKLTHINYAFLLPNADGTLRPIENPAKLQSLVATAHSRGVKVLISVGGWMNDGNPTEFASIGSNATYTRNFATNLVSFASQYGLDGIDIDWEHPTAGTANGYANVMQELGTQLHSRGKLLTTAVAGGTWAGPYILDRALAALDFVNVMAYDDAPPAHSTYSLASQSMSYWRGRGLAASKLVLGVPFYGQAGGETFASLVARGADPYADLFQGIGYNGITTIKSKTNLAFDQGSGIMIWQLAGDAVGQYSLLTAINQVVVQRNGNTTSAQAIPGRLEAESFTAQQGTQTEPTTDTGGGINVDWYETGDWLDYTVNVASAGTYTVGFRVASANGGATLQLRNSSGGVLGSIGVGNTGGWQSWQTISTTVTLPAGRQTLRLYAAASTGCNVNWLNFTGATSSFSATFQAESYSSMNGVQVEGCSDTGGGQNVGYIDAGDWLAYTPLTIPTTGSYLIEYRVASPSGGTVSSDLNAGSIQLGNTAIPATGGWQSWTTVSRTVTLPAGTYSFGVYAQTGGWNLNWVRISSAAARTGSTAAALVSPEEAALLPGQISLFPNPVTDRLTVQGPGLNGSAYQVLDAYGTVKSSGVVSQQAINLSALPAGVYTLRIVGPQQQKITRQLIKQ